MFRFEFLIVLLIIVVVVLNMFVEGFTCPPDDGTVRCRQPKECMFSDPNNCAGFIECDEAGQTFPQQCNLGLLWNDRIKNCDHPARSTCRASSRR